MITAGARTKGHARSRSSGTQRRLPLLMKLFAAYVALLFLFAIFGGLLPIGSHEEINLLQRLQPPIGFGGSWRYPLGTDELGRDMVARLLFSVRISLLIGVCATGLGAVLGTLAGFLAAHFRGWVDQLLMGLVDFQATLPFLILALAVLAFVGGSYGVLILLLSLHGWERYARVARGLAMSAIKNGYAEAVAQLGAHPIRVYANHILPNVASTLIVSMTITLPEVIIAESSLSFLGLGVQPPDTSLGLMIANGREYLSSAPWIIVIPAVVLSLLALSVSLLGDHLRDRLDATLR